MPAHWIKCMFSVKVKTVLVERLNFAFIFLAVMLRYHKPLLPGRHVPTSQLRNYSTLNSKRKLFWDVILCSLADADFDSFQMLKFLFLYLNYFFFWCLKRKKFDSINTRPGYVDTQFCLWAKIQSQVRIVSSVTTIFLW